MNSSCNCACFQGWSQKVLHLTADFLPVFHALLCRNNGHDQLKDVHSDHRDNCILYIAHNARCSLLLKMFSPVVMLIAFFMFIHNVRCSLQLKMFSPVVSCILYIIHNVRCSLQLKMFSPVVNCILCIAHNVTSSTMWDVHYSWRCFSPVVKLIAFFTSSTMWGVHYSWRCFSPVVKFIAFFTLPRMRDVHYSWRCFLQLWSSLHSLHHLQSTMRHVYYQLYDGRFCTSLFNINDLPEKLCRWLAWKTEVVCDDGYSWIDAILEHSSKYSRGRSCRVTKSKVRLGTVFTWGHS